MGMKFADYPINGIDISQFQGLVNYDALDDTQSDFFGIRSSYGKTPDYRFVRNWDGLKGRALRFAYHYLDYYSNWYNPSSAVFGMSNEEWGRVQARKVYDLTKTDNDNVIAFLDIESGGTSYSPAITTCWARVEEIMDGFFAELDFLTGKRNGAYCSLGLLDQFSVRFRDRPLWVAWYTEIVTLQKVIDSVISKGWKAPYIWQYASHGDIDGNGTGDGLSYGVASKALDLNIWMKSKADFDLFASGQAPVQAEEKMLFQAKVIVQKINIRSGAGKTFTDIGDVYYGNILPVYEVSGDWLRIGTGKWVAEREGTGVYIERIPLVVPDPIDMTNVLKVEPFSQKDPRWANIQLGTSTSTIGGYGCLITCASMMLKYLGFDTDPARLNTWLKNNAGYASVNLFVWDSLERLYPRLKFTNRYVGAQLDKIDETLLKGVPVIINVDYVPSTPYIEQHWVIVVGKEGGSYIIIDPRNGQLVRFEELYGDPLKKIYHVCTYSFSGVVVTDQQKLEKLWQAHPDLH